MDRQAERNSAIAQPLAGPFPFCGDDFLILP
jgi:hypothetical protein